MKPAPRPWTKRHLQVREDHLFAWKWKGKVLDVHAATDADTDIDGNGIVDFLDLGQLKQAFFGPPGPSGLPNACL